MTLPAAWDWEHVFAMRDKLLGDNPDSVQGYEDYMAWFRAYEVETGAVYNRTDPTTLRDPNIAHRAQDIAALHGLICHHCGHYVSMIQGEYHVDHFIPIDFYAKLGIPYRDSISNWRLTHPECNMTKGASIAHLMHWPW